ncbi:divalent metal cation transporter [Acetobacteraceae bacterium KSS8]|uniref:Divalent metal cation transporter n=1 Tax=Endosaccharibacter trunci TaxID=2812733 RepID=A0ABT1W2K8_9PROT|nr:divalent metal cation transporter [Acetobacteraceae bacterium KSS8]
MLDTFDTIAPAATGHGADSHRACIRGALGTIRANDLRPRPTLAAKLRTLAAIVGPGLIVMVGDNDAGAFATYTQAGQDYGTSLLWTLLLLGPVLYVNQEMVLRLGAVAGVGHARLILQRFGRFWGAFSVLDLFVLNGLTIVTEFIGVSIGLDFLGLPKLWGVLAAAAATMLAAATGSFRRFERFALTLCLGSFLLVPVAFAVHPPLGVVAHDLLVPRLPAGGKLADVLLLIIAIVGTTVAPWQLFFQQSYVIDKRITPRFISYERADLLIGIAVVLLGGVAMIAFSAATFAGHPEAGTFTDAGGVMSGLARYVGHVPATLFAIALIDASIIGAAAVSLASAYALGDVFSLSHSLHRPVREARGFYLFYAALIAGAAILVLLPGAPLGLITEAVQSLAGILLPSATVFLLLLCNDRDVLGPWVNGFWTNLFTGAVIAVLVLLSIVLTVSVLYPQVTGSQILIILGAGLVLAMVVSVPALLLRRGEAAPATEAARSRLSWRMPALETLPPARLGRGTRIWMTVLRLYLLAAVALVLIRVTQLALAH